MQLSKPKISTNQATGNPSLGQQTISNATPIVCSKNVPAPQSSQPKLADLAKLNLKVPTIVKNSAPGSMRPSLSELARVKLNAEGSRPFSSLVNRPVTSASSLEPGLSLASALRSKCSLQEEKLDRPTTIVNKKDPLLSSLLVSSNETPIEQLLTAQASALGRVLAMEGSQSQTVFLKFQNRRENSRSFELKPFNFCTPSPDDAIKCRLRVTQ